MVFAKAISTKDYAVGDLICSEMPLVNVLYDKEKSKFCENCLCPSSETIKLKMCSACNHMHYCSSDCQKADWKAGHMYECKIYKNHYDKLKEVDLRLLFRTQLLLKNRQELAFRKVKLQFDESAAKSYNDLDKIEIAWEFSSVQQLVSAFDHILDTFSKIRAIDLIDRLTLLNTYFYKQIRNSILVFYKNNFVAYGIYTIPSVFGHSCAPNATRSFNGYRQDIRAIKEIKKGEPITLCYARVDTSREDRQSFLKSTYNIDCKCERCTGSLDNVFHYDRLETLKCTMDIAEETGYFVKAFEAGKKLIPLYRTLGGYEFTVSWHLMRLVELYQKMSTVEQDDSIVDVLETTVRHLNVSHGVDHPHCKEYSELLEECRQKLKKKSPKMKSKACASQDNVDKGLSGNYVISTKDYAVGDLICSEMPFASVVQKDAKSKFCDNCLCPSSNTVDLIKCMTCQKMYYCSSTCQKADLEAGHKYECEIYKYHYKDLEKDDPRLLLRTHFLLENNKELAFRKASLQNKELAEKSFNDLDKVDHKKSFSLQLAMMRIVEIVDKCDLEELINSDTLIEHFSTQSRNSLSVFYKYDYVGYGNYTSPSIFGHSCAPNATRSFNGYRQDIRAIKEIKKGEPITISMSRVDSSREDRQSFLKSAYNIDCKCERCTGSFDNEFNYKHMEALELEMNTSEHVEEKFDKAFEAGKRLIPIYKRLCGFDITLSWHLMRMAEICRKMSTMEQDCSIVGVLEATVRHLKVTHGIDHPHYKEYSELLEKKKQEKYGKKLSNDGGDF